MSPIRAGDTRIVLDYMRYAGLCWAHWMWWILFVIESWRCLNILNSCRRFHIGFTWCISSLYANIAIELWFGYLVLRSIHILSLISEPYYICCSWLFFWDSMLLWTFQVVKVSIIFLSKSRQYFFDVKLNTYRVYINFYTRIILLHILCRFRYWS